VTPSDRRWEFLPEPDRRKQACFVATVLAHHMPRAIMPPRG